MVTDQLRNMCIVYSLFQLLIQSPESKITQAKKSSQSKQKLKLKLKQHTDKNVCSNLNGTVYIQIDVHMNWLTNFFSFFSKYNQTHHIQMPSHADTEKCFPFLLYDAGTILFYIFVMYIICTQCTQYSSIQNWINNL